MQPPMKRQATITLSLISNWIALEQVPFVLYSTIILPPDEWIFLHGAKGCFFILSRTQTVYHTFCMSAPVFLKLYRKFRKTCKENLPILSGYVILYPENEGNMTGGFYDSHYWSDEK
jgi:hypothetical protein